jgi:hypothetical protein
VITYSGSGVTAPALADGSVDPRWLGYLVLWLWRTCSEDPRVPVRTPAWLTLEDVS